MAKPIELTFFEEIRSEIVENPRFSTIPEVERFAVLTAAIAGEKDLLFVTQTLPPSSLKDAVFDLMIQRMEKNLFSIRPSQEKDVNKRLHNKIFKTLKDTHIPQYMLYSILACAKASDFFRMSVFLRQMSDWGVPNTVQDDVSNIVMNELHESIFCPYQDE